MQAFCVTPEQGMWFVTQFLNTDRKSVSGSVAGPGEGNKDKVCQSKDGGKDHKLDIMFKRSKQMNICVYANHGP